MKFSTFSNTLVVDNAIPTANAPTIGDNPIEPARTAAKKKVAKRKPARKTAAKKKVAKRKPARRTSKTKRKTRRR